VSDPRDPEVPDGSGATPAGRHGDDEWRIEADPRWLARHKSDNFSRFRRRLRSLGLDGMATATADGLDAFGLQAVTGTRRNPKLRIDSSPYSAVRYARLRYQYTAVQIDTDRCRRRGYPHRQVHRILAWDVDRRRVVGAVRVCPRCQTDSWMFRCHMPWTGRARARSRKVVL
jgi:hypothetical protein